MDLKTDLRLLICALSLRPHLLLMLNYKKQVKQKKNPSLLYCVYTSTPSGSNLKQKENYLICVYFPISPYTIITIIIIISKYSNLKQSSLLSINVEANDTKREHENRITTITFKCKTMHRDY
uniref:(northern house mosquito) hypothetical protein n=1 Tax=Culex pipiens TaxID=7175 RepID=A0A8D8NDV5_CULPI